MNKFKVGDKIKCIDSGGSTLLKLGEIYKVHSYNEEYHSVSPFSENSCHSYDSSRFELVNSKQDYSLQEIREAKNALEKELLNNISKLVGDFQTKFGIGLDSIDIECSKNYTLNISDGRLVLYRVSTSVNI